MPASPGEVVGGSLLLVLLLLPTGLALLKLLELLLRWRFRLSFPERLLLAFYSAGALVFLFASIPFDLYGAPLLGGILGVGAASYVALAARGKFVGVRSAASFSRSFDGIALAVGSVGLLVFEITPVWNHAFPNAWDGSVTALWMNLTLRHGTLPLNLQPYASAPVVYPLATTVWMTVPVLLLGWPIVQTPVLLPPLFLSLTVPAAYCWGARWTAASTTAKSPTGLLFAAFFGLVASWPRFYTGGSYDFAFALPLFLLAVGLVPGFSRAPNILGRTLVAFGLLAGVLTSLSLSAGEALLVLFLVYSLIARRHRLRDALAAIGSVVVVAVFEIAFSLRSLTVWLASGRPSYTSAGEYGALNARLVQGELDPFVPWKAKLSPFPWLSLELQILLVVGLLLATWAIAGSIGGARHPSVAPFSTDLMVGMVAMFTMTGFLLPSALPGPVASGLRGFTNLDQSSTLLFIFFEGVCAFPLFFAMIQITTSTTSPSLRPSNPRDDPSRGVIEYRRPHRPTPFRRTLGTLAVLVLIITLVSGAWFSLASGEGYIQQNVGKTSNVTAADVAAMKWMGSHLPDCSGVLVAPGSAGQFLPEYALVRLILPMNPVPSNESYTTAIGDLTSGVFDNDTGASLLALHATEVFVTGRTSASYPAFAVTSFMNTSDFLVLFSLGDATLYAFVPGVDQTQCSP